MKPSFFKKSMLNYEMEKKKNKSKKNLTPTLSSLLNLCPKP
jgi:hypothetical protein